jgi:uncharacterized protein YodC (DUF2158 family)
MSEENQFPFEPGEVVQLNSGGPMMTVEAAQDGAVTCKWFDTNWMLLTSDFPAECLSARPEARSGVRPQASRYGAGRVGAL